MLLENQKFRIPRGDAHSVEMTDVWIDEMRNHTFQMGKVVSIGAHDDTAMACWLCDQAVRLGGFSWSFGDDYADDARPEFAEPSVGHGEEGEAEEGDPLGVEESKTGGGHWNPLAGYTPGAGGSWQF